MFWNFIHDSGYVILLGIAAYFALFYVIRFVCIFVALVRTPIATYQTEHLDSYSLTPPQQAVLDELMALGFIHPQAFGMKGAPDGYTGIVLSHISKPAFATISFQSRWGMYYPVGFESFTQDKKQLVTVNLSPGIMPTDGAQMKDAKARTLAQQWEFHQRWIAGEKTATPPRDEAFDHIVSFSERYYAEQLAKGTIKKLGDSLHYTIKSAVKITFTIMRMQKAFRRGFTSAATSAEHVDQFYAECYEFHEALRATQKKRPHVMLGLLILSIGLFYIVYASLLTWIVGLALLVVLFVHEMGHAVVMRYFGYRDMSMFFIPMVGAVVTGRVEKIAAWKQATILLAGPMPGLLVGLGMMIYGQQHKLSEDWATVAWLLVGINAFNLLPFAPLDGGRLVELLFSGRRKMTLCFYAISSAAALASALYFETFMFVLLFIVMSLSTLAEYRLFKLSKQWHGKPGDFDSLPSLFAAARETMRKRASFARCYYLVRTVFTPAMINRATKKEGVVILCLLIAAWAGPIWVYSEYAGEEKDQKAFSNALNDYWDNQEYDISAKEVNAKIKDYLSKLKQAAAKLKPDDPRHNDVAVLEIGQLPGQQQTVEYAKLLREHKFGFYYPAISIAGTYLTRISGEHDVTPVKRVEKLTDAIAFAERETGDKNFFELINTKIKLAEAYEEAGKQEKATELMEVLRKELPDMEIYTQETFLSAYAWREIARGHTENAIAILKTSTPKLLATKYFHRYIIDLGWALIISGDTAAGLEQMKAESTGKAKTFKDGTPINYLDLAYAYMKSGQTEETKRLLSNEWAQDECKDNYMHQPTRWHDKKMVALKSMLAKYCSNTKPSATHD